MRVAVAGEYFISGKIICIFTVATCAVSIYFVHRQANQPQSGFFISPFLDASATVTARFHGRCRGFDHQNILRDLKAPNPVLLKKSTAGVHKMVSTKLPESKGSGAVP